MELATATISVAPEAEDQTFTVLHLDHLVVVTAISGRRVAMEILAKNAIAHGKSSVFLDFKAAELVLTLGDLQPKLCINCRYGIPNQWLIDERAKSVFASTSMPGPYKEHGLG